MRARPVRLTGMNRLGGPRRADGRATTVEILDAVPYVGAQQTFYAKRAVVLLTHGPLSVRAALPIAKEVGDPVAYLGDRAGAGAAEPLDHPLDRDRPDRF